MILTDIHDRRRVCGFSYICPAAWSLRSLLGTGVASSAYLYVTIGRHASPTSVRVPQLRDPAAAQVQIKRRTQSDLLSCLSTCL